MKITKTKIAMALAGYVGSYYALITGLPHLINNTSPVTHEPSTLSYVFMSLAYTFITLFYLPINLVRYFINVMPGTHPAVYIMSCMAIMMTASIVYLGAHAVRRA